MINESQAHKFCCEDITTIENYDEAVADTVRMWHCHHRLGVRNGKNVTAELKANNMYENRPASELIFVTPSQHAKLHPDVRSKGGKKGIAKMTFKLRSKGGKKAVKIMHTKTTHEQHVKGGKAGGAKSKGMLYWNNGTINKRSKECPGEGWVHGQLKRRAK